MRRLFGWAFSLAAAVSALLCVADVLITSRATTRYDRVVIHIGTHVLMVDSSAAWVFRELDNLPAATDFPQRPHYVSFPPRQWPSDQVDFLEGETIWQRTGVEITPSAKWVTDSAFVSDWSKIPMYGPNSGPYH